MQTKLGAAKEEPKCLDETDSTLVQCYCEGDKMSEGCVSEQSYSSLLTSNSDSVSGVNTPS